MTRKTFPLMILIGAVLVAGMFAGCGPKAPSRAEVLQRQVYNLEAQLDSAKQQLASSGDQSGDLRAAQQEIRDKDLEIRDLERQLASKPAVVTPPAGAREVITVSGGVLFTTGSADLTSAGKSKLNSIAADIKSRYPGKHISVEGHTDNSQMIKTKPKWGTNTWLSANRANAVANHLISQGISESLVSVVGHGPSRPTGRGNDQDRRVEIIVLAR